MAMVEANSLFVFLLVRALTFERKIVSINTKTMLTKDLKGGASIETTEPASPTKHIRVRRIGGQVSYICAHRFNIGSM